jgi:hypothetical protein
LQNIYKLRKILCFSIVLAVFSILLPVASIPNLSHVRRCLFPSLLAASLPILLCCRRNLGWECAARGQDEGVELRSQGKRGRTTNGRIMFLDVRRKSIPFSFFTMALP